MKKNVVTHEFEEFYPNDVKFVSEKTLLVLGEHSNRLMSYDLVSGKHRFIFGYSGFDGGSEVMTVDEIINMEKSTALLGEPEHPDTSLSLASINYAGDRTLYSPNGFIVLDDETILIADTDNNRIVRIDPGDGTILGTIGGVYNPVSLLVKPYSRVFDPATDAFAVTR